MLPWLFRVIFMHNISVLLGQWPPAAGKPQFDLQSTRQAIFYPGKEIHPGLSSITGIFATARECWQAAVLLVLLLPPGLLPVAALVVV